MIPTDPSTHDGRLRYAKGNAVRSDAPFEPLVFVVSAPSGTGKSTLVAELIGSVPRLRRVVTCTTRAPRPDEVDGAAYHFLERGEFDARVAQGGFIEWNEIYGDRYGTSRQVFEKTLEEARRSREDLLLVIDVDGKDNFVAEYAEAVTIFVLPPSIEALRSRLEGRGSEHAEAAARRLERARREIGRADRYRYQVVNDSLERAVQELRTIVETERARRDAAAGRPFGD
jgi:guanylate kinase